MSNREYLEFRILKLSKLLIPTIQEEIRKTLGHPDNEHYRVMLAEYQTELRERKKKIEGHPLDRGEMYE
jgi:hypothetical protein